MIGQRKSKAAISVIILTVMVGLLWLTNCTGQPTAPSPEPTPELRPTLQPSGKTIVVTSTADSGPGTLRQALLDAQSSDTIIFDSNIFPVNAPATIKLRTGLPHISQGNITIDASNAGVILDGSNMSEDFVSGLEISSSRNTVWGLQILNFSPGAGISVVDGAQRNKIGGDRNVGSGPLGEGNLVSKGDIGIRISDVGTSFNIVTGNLIGTDVHGIDAWGSSGSGIRIENGADNNTIGPDNVIAYGSVYGIEISDSRSSGNTITGNSIHDNERGGIYLWEGANSELPAPLVFDFDLGAGSVNGAACANCTIEIFSDSSNQGAVYEGQTVADSAGAFSFNKGASFTGSHLTATSTDANGNTSEFSVPTSGTRRVVSVQEGNHLPRIRFQARRARELADNRIGHIFSDFWHLQDFQGLLDTEICGLGAKRVKLTINEAEPMSMLGQTEAHIDWSKPEFSILPIHDDFITGIVNNGITITYVLTFWDKANHPEGWEPIPSRFKTEEEIQRYLEYVRFVVRHFKDRVQYFEIWNEPSGGPPLHQIQVADYINLVRRAVPVIRQEYPEAKIVVGSVAGMDNQEDREYLFRILRSDVMPLVDVVAWHPMFGDSPEYRSQYYYEYPSIVQYIKDVASAHGFKGEYRAEELVWRSPDCPWCDPRDPLYSNTVATKYYARGIVIHLGMDLTVGVTGNSSFRLESFSVIQNLSTLMAGAKPLSLPVEIKSEATNVRSYSFSLPNENMLLALWTDGVAVDDDPGIEATLTIPGVLAKKVVGIDVIHGFEQEVITSVVDGNLVVRNLLIKDYPIVFRLVK